MVSDYPKECLALVEEHIEFSELNLNGALRQHSTGTGHCAHNNSGG